MEGGRAANPYAMRDGVTLNAARPHEMHITKQYFVAMYSRICCILRVVGINVQFIGMPNIRLLSEVNVCLTVCTCIKLHRVRVCTMPRRGDPLACL